MANRPILSCGARRALTYITKLMVNDSTRSAAFIKGLEHISFYIYDCTVRERLYLAKEISEDLKQLEGHIVALYTTVLRFMLKVRLFFEASAASKCHSTSHSSDCSKCIPPMFRTIHATNLALRLLSIMYMFALNIPHKLQAKFYRSSRTCDLQRIQVC